MSEKKQMNLIQYWNIVKRWWWLVAASVLVASVSSYLAVSRTPRIYRATTAVRIGQAIVKPNPDYQDFAISQQLALTYVDMVKRQPILVGAAEALGLGYVPWSGNVSANIVPGTQLIEISVRDTSPQRARALADEIARQLILQTPTDSEEAQERRAFVEKQLAALEESIQEAQREIQEELVKLDAANSARAIQQHESNITVLQQKLSSHQSSYASLAQMVQQAAATTTCCCSTPRHASCSTPARAAPAARSRMLSPFVRGTRPRVPAAKPW